MRFPISRHRLPWAFAVAATFAIGALSAVTACGGDEEEQQAQEQKAEEERKRAERALNNDFIPVEAPNQNPLPDNAGPYNGPPPVEDPPPPPPMPEGGSGPADTGGTPETGSES